MYTRTYHANTPCTPTQSRASTHARTHAHKCVCMLCRTLSCPLTTCAARVCARMCTRTDARTDACTDAHTHAQTRVCTDLCNQHGLACRQCLAIDRTHAQARDNECCKPVGGRAQVGQHVCARVCACACACVYMRHACVCTSHASMGAYACGQADRCVHLWMDERVFMRLRACLCMDPCMHACMRAGHWCACLG